MASSKQPTRPTTASPAVSEITDTPSSAPAQPDPSLPSFSASPATLPRITLSFHALRQLTSLLPLPPPAVATPRLQSPKTTTKKKTKDDGPASDPSAPLTYVFSFPSFASLIPALPSSALPTAAPSAPAVFSPPIVLDQSTSSILPLTFAHVEEVRSPALLLDALSSADFTLSLYAFSPVAASDKKGATAARKGKDAAPAESTSAYPPESLTLLSSVRVPTDPLKLLPPTWLPLPLRPTSAAPAPSALPEQTVSATPELQLSVTVSEELVKPEEAEQCFTLTVTVGAVRRLPADVLPDEGGPTRPGSAAVASPRSLGKAAKAGKKDDRDTDGVYTLVYEVPVAESEKRTVWTERIILRRLTDEERAEAPTVRGRWNDAREEANAAAAAAEAAEPAKREAAAPAARKGGKAPTTTAAPSTPRSAVPAVATAPSQPSVSGSVLVFDHRQSVLLGPTALQPLTALITGSLFPVQLTVTKPSSDPADPIRGLALVDLGELAKPGVTRVEGWWALTQTGGLPQRPAASPAAEAGKKVIKIPAASKATDTFDACRSCVWLSVELSRPLSPIPEPLPISALLPAPVVAPPSLLSALFPPSLAFLSQPPPHLLSSLHDLLAPLLTASTSPSSLLPLTRRLEPLLAELAECNHGAEDAATPADKDRIRNELWLEVMRAVTRWHDEQRDGKATSRRANRLVMVADAIRRWGTQAAEAEEMSDVALARLHHENRITAATGWTEEEGGGEAAQAALVDALYDYAAFALRRGETEHAEVSLRKVLSIAQHVPSLLLLAVVLLEAGYLREADDLLHQLPAPSSAEPLAVAVLSLLYQHTEQDELLEAAVSGINPTLALLPATQPPSPLTAAALGSLPFTQLGWSFDGSAHVSLLGARYALAMGLPGSAHVWVRAVLGAEDVRGIEEEKEGPNADANRNAVRYGAWLHRALLLLRDGETAVAAEHAARIVRALELHSPASTASTTLAPAVRLYFLTRLAAIMQACRRMDDCEALLLAYTALIPAHRDLPLHLPSLAALTRLLLAKQNRVMALSLLSSLLPSTTPSSALSSPWLHLLYAEALYADGQYSEAMAQCSEASLREPGNSRVYAQLCCGHCKLWKAKQAQRRARRSRRAAPSPPLPVHLHLLRLLPLPLPAVAGVDGGRPPLLRAVALRAFRSADVHHAAAVGACDGLPVPGGRAGVVRARDAGRGRARVARGGEGGEGGGGRQCADGY